MGGGREDIVGGGVCAVFRSFLGAFKTWLSQQTRAWT